ncbi:protein ripply2-like [Clupea harengus]|uniref:Protein ripply2-like n=1 Tax=Clupea harengus TaxID=7950 RepID=A0A6P8GTF9_CLUHA|nr:protein ripply2-like [Clupea harengus]
MEYSTCLPRAMEISMNSPFGHTGYNNENTTHERALFWRPWAQGPLKQSTDSHESYVKPPLELSDAKKPNNVVHPTKLFWPRSNCYDYLYHDAEALLSNYPVQATICLYTDSSSDEEDSEEEDEKEMN